ncbi:MAG: FAD-linked oxidase C-terminal domain-containing protein, partial [Bacteroidota bacterium]
LAFITEIKLHCDPLPPATTGLLCAHFESVDASLRAVIAAMKHQPRAVELMDKIVMDCTKENRLYQNHRFFIEGDPEAVLVIEVGGESETEIQQQLDVIEAEIKALRLGYSFPRVFGVDRIKKVWALRSAGLGLLANVPGDAKPVAVIEDTAVPLADLPEYIREFADVMEGFAQRAVYYAHAGAGELHLRPILDLKQARDRKHFREIGLASAELVKKYHGSLSGEHGDGRVRAEFLPLMIGNRNYALLNRLKHQWDPQRIFNPGKIVEAPPMDQSLRYDEGQRTKQFETVINFGDTDGILRAAEKCNGSGDCRKTHLFGGTMCPSYQATRSEKETTRARANILREILTRSEAENPFASEEIKEVMDLCLSCKGCASECPSNVNVALLKAEFQYQYQKTHGVPLRTRAIANISRLNRLAMILPGLSNFFLKRVSLLKSMMGVAKERSLP